MVTLTVVSDSKYYTRLGEDLHGVEYYAEKDSVKGFWQGELAEEEGLSGNGVTEQHMERIKGLSNSGRLGLDITYSASKSVSLAYTLLNDSRILEAHERAVKVANEYLEKNLVFTRQGRGGREHVQARGVAIANFTHLTSRELDPQLHTHSVLLNSVIRSSDGKVTALEPKVIFQYQKTLDQIYKNELARSLQDLGYRVEMKDRNGNFEIVGFSKEMLAKFSGRKEQVEQALRQLRRNEKLQGLSDHELRDIARLETRQAKGFLSKEELNTIWNKKLRELGITKDQVRESVEKAKEQLNELKKPSEEKEFGAAKEYIRQAYSVIHENESAFTKHKLIEIALRQSLNDAAKGRKAMTVEQIESALNQLQKEKEIVRVKGTEYFTTQEMQKREKWVIDFVKRTNGTEKELVSDKSAINRAIMEFEQKKSISMTHDQRKAVFYVARSKDKIIGIQGGAGVGKTTSFECLKTLLESEGYTVRGLAPTGKAAEELGKCGINAQTLDSFLLHFEKTSIVKDLEKYKQEYERLNERFEGRFWFLSPDAIAGNAESRESQLKDYVNEVIRKAGVWTRKDGTSRREHEDRAFVIEKKDLRVQIVVEYGDRFRRWREVNVYLKDMETGEITHSRYTSMRSENLAKGHSKRYQSVDKVIRYGKEVWILDEASMIGSMKMHSLLQAARLAGARVVVAGDTKQMKAVEQGKIFQEMQTRGMTTLMMKEKVRQVRTPYREVVEDLGDKKFQEVVRRLEESGRVREILSRVDRMEAIKREYINGDHRRTHIVAATNKEKNELNQAIREELKGAGKVRREGHILTVRESKNLSGEEKRYAFSYSVGDSIHVPRNVMKEMGISSRTNEFLVKSVNSKQNTITVTNSVNEFQVDLTRFGSRISVYSTKQIEICKDEKIMTLKNDKRLGIKNGESWVVKSIDKQGNITLKNDSKEKSFNVKAYNYIDYGYASTVYKSQGMTVRKVIYCVSEKTNYNENVHRVNERSGGI
ncbi:MAG: MobF family relaxase [Candidatus Methanomethyliaceae archaeon]